MVCSFLLPAGLPTHLAIGSEQPVGRGFQVTDVRGEQLLGPAWARCAPHLGHT